MTSESEITLNLESGSNKIQVNTDLDCQGSYFEEIFVSEEVSFYPNPTRGYLQVYVAGEDSEVLVKLFDGTGNLLNQKSKSVSANRVIELDLNGKKLGPLYRKNAGSDPE